MLLPHAEEAIIDPRKLRDYVLSFQHPIGRFKAYFFAGLGFSVENWESLDSEIRRLALKCDAETAELSAYGQKYLVRGRVVGPEERNAEVVTVWIVRLGERPPRFVTVYPED